MLMVMCTEGRGLLGTWQCFPLPSETHWISDPLVQTSLRHLGTMRFSGLPSAVFTNQTTLPWKGQKGKTVSSGYICLQLVLFPQITLE